MQPLTISWAAGQTTSEDRTFLSSQSVSNGAYGDISLLFGGKAGNFKIQAGVHTTYDLDWTTNSDKLFTVGSKLQNLAPAYYTAWTYHLVKYPAWTGWTQQLLKILSYDDPYNYNRALRGVTIADSAPWKISYVIGPGDYTVGGTTTGDTTTASLGVYSGPNACSLNATESASQKAAESERKRFEAAMDSVPHPASLKARGINDMYAAMEANRLLRKHAKDPAKIPADSPAARLSPQERRELDEYLKAIHRHIIEQIKREYPGATPPVFPPSAKTKPAPQLKINGSPVNAQAPQRIGP
jgi:hypothetical protein